MLWVNTARVVPRNQPDEWRNITSNERIRGFNAAAKAIMQEMGIPVMDAFQFSDNSAFEALARDGIHFGTYDQAYYRYVAMMILHEVCVLARI